jgi:hypothetical protein
VLYQLSYLASCGAQFCGAQSCGAQFCGRTV